MSFGVADDVFERRLHDGVQLLVHHRLFPEVALAVLHPLKIRSGHAARVGQNVGDDEDAFIGEDVVGGGGCRAVRAFGQNAALDAISVAAGDDILGGGRIEKKKVLDEQVGGLALFRAGESVDGAVFLAEVDERLQTDAVLVVQAAAHFPDADDLVTCLIHQQGGIGAHVAEALHDDARALARQAQLLAGLIAHHHHAAAGGFATSAGAADVDGLSGDDGGDRLPHVHGVGVHHPRHDLFVGVDVGGGDVFFRADEFDQLGGVAAGHALQFAHRHFVRIADYAAFGSAERDVDHGALPGHPAGEGADFVEGDVGRVADAALGRSSG